MSLSLGFSRLLINGKSRKHLAFELHVMKCLRVSRCTQQYYRHYSKTKILISSVTARKKTKSLSDFDLMVEKRRKEASKTVAIQVGASPSPISAVLQTLETCQQFGEITKAICTSSAQPPGKSLVLVEFREKEMTDRLLKSCIFDCDDGALPVRSRFLYNNAFKASSKNEISYDTYDPPDVQSLANSLANCSDASEQMKRLFESESLGEYGFRTRFLVCREIEDALSGLFPVIQALPFGSTVNGFGKYDCDLDMFIEFGTKKDSETKAFYFQNKKRPAEGRTRTQRTLQLVGDLLQNFSPNVCNVNRIVHARVPILKFQQERLQLECDISITNMTGYYMSELLFLYGQLDPRLHPLVFTIRKWAANAKITNEIPGNWITNFSLSLMTIFFLQNVAVLPSLNKLKQLARANDKRTAAEVDCSFCRNAKSVKRSENCDDLSSLLTQFYEFYLNFDFKDSAISVLSGNAQVKQFGSALYIVNPLEQELNVSMNATTKEVQNFKSKAEMALESLNQGPTSNNEDWGILKLFATIRTTVTSKESRQRKFQINEVLDKNEPPQFNSPSSLTRPANKPKVTNKPKVPVEKPLVKSKRLLEINKKLVHTVSGLGRRKGKTIWTTW